MQYKLSNDDTFYNILVSVNNFIKTQQRQESNNTQTKYSTILNEHGEFIIHYFLLHSFKISSKNSISRAVVGGSCL
jgi:hypothetical protein